MLAPVLLGLVAACGRSPAGPAGRTSLVLVSLDTCRADRLACYGGDPAIAPALARFAEQAAVLDDCLSQSGLTAPSHMSLFTGHYVHRHGLLNNRGGIDPPYTLASVLAAAGWRTAAFTGHGSLQARHGAAHGFELFESSVGELSWPYTRDLADVVPRGLEWLAAQGDAPTFLFLHAYDPHAPYWPAEPVRERFAGGYRGGFDPSRLTVPNEYARLLQQGTLGPDELRYVNALYDGELAEADQAFGALLEGLRASGRLERSIVVFTSDHGECLGEHGWVGHSTLWDPILRVPLLIRFPGGRWAGHVEGPAQLVDLLPTLCAALGVEPPEGLQGIDLLPWIRGEAGDHGHDRATNRLRIARVGARQNQISVREGTRWKLVFSEGATPDEIKGLKLYDLASDPAEEHNLARSGEDRARAAALLERYRAFRASTAADDRRFASTPRAAHEDDEDDDAEQEELRALGYAGDDE